jgi:hypothetical protein
MSDYHYLYSEQAEDDVKGRSVADEYADMIADAVFGSVRFPEIVVVLSGTDGNAFSVLARVRKSLRKAGVRADVIDEFTVEATSGDYDRLLQTCMKWVTVE